MNKLLNNAGRMVLKNEKKHARINGPLFRQKAEDLAKK